MNNFSSTENKSGLLKSFYDDPVGDALQKRLKKSLEKMKMEQAQKEGSQYVKDDDDVDTSVGR